MKHNIPFMSYLIKRRYPCVCINAHACLVQKPYIVCALYITVLPAFENTNIALVNKLLPARPCMDISHHSLRAFKILSGDADDKRLVFYGCCSWRCMNNKDDRILFVLLTYILDITQICSGITSGRVLDGEFLYTKILEVNLFAFAYRLFHEDFSPINEAMQ